MLWCGHANRRSTARDGQLAANAVEKVHNDLILMDLQMPNMNGIDAARKIREKLGELRNQHNFYKFCDANPYRMVDQSA
jgi:CheY-like chemotaxis protein